MLSRLAPTAVVFDMDGVLVDSARVHARAWKQAFDQLLERMGDPAPFAVPSDYRRFVDGRPRYEGVAAFLASRDIELPRGDPSDPPGMATIMSVGNLKNDVFLGLLEDEEIEPLDGVIELLDSLVADETPTAVVSSSRNTDRILPASIRGRVNLVLGGNDLDARQLPGKPEPDMFIAATDGLGVTPGEGAVVEDSPAGVRAGRRGGFSLVVGIDDRSGSAGLEALADVVTTGLSQLPHHVLSWADLLEPPAPALENLGVIRHRIDGAGGDYPTLLYIGADEAELAAVRKREGVGVIVDPRPPPMTWADFSVRNQKEADRVSMLLNTR